jgi:hypothetical protein
MSVVVTLMLTSLAKLFSALGTAKVLDLPQALLPLTNRQSFWLVGLVELAIAADLILDKNPRRNLTLVMWLGCNFILYRAAAAILTVGKPCPCLGSLTEKLPLAPGVIDRILITVALYLFLGSLFFLVVPCKGELPKKSVQDVATGATDTATENTELNQLQSMDRSYE